MNEKMQERIAWMHALFTAYLDAGPSEPPEMTIASGVVSAVWLYPEFEARLEIDVDSGEASVVLSKDGVSDDFDVSIDFEDEDEMLMFASELDGILADLGQRDDGGLVAL